MLVSQQQHSKTSQAGHGYHHGTALAVHSWGMVADDAEELVADEPEVPVVELVTQESPREGSSKV